MGEPALQRARLPLVAGTPRVSRWSCWGLGIQQLPDFDGRPTTSRAGLGRGGLYEAHISAQQSSPFSEARFSCSHEHEGRTCRAEGTARQGSVPPVGVIGRLHGRSVFARLREQGVRVRVGWLWCSMVIDPTAKKAHVGYAIGRRVGGAVERNLLRRRLRASLACRGDVLPPGWYLVGVSPRSPQPTWSEVDSAVARLVASVTERAGRR